MADMMLPVDTAVVVPVNIYPLVDETDGFTREAVAYNAAGMALEWNFVTAAGAMSQTPVTPTTGGDYDWADLGGGMMKIEIPASAGASINNDTKGFGWFTGKCTATRPWRGPVIQFSPAIVVNSLVSGSDKLEVDLVSILGTALTETAGLIAAAFKKFFNIATPTGTVNSLPDAVPTAAGGLIAATADAVWDESIVNHQAVGSAGESLGAPLGGAVVSDASNSIISFKTDLASTVDGYCIGSFLKFTTGNCINQVRKISNYGGTSKLLLVTSGFTEIPAVADKFIIINQ
jgi:hypothetical protein